MDLFDDRQGSLVLGQFIPRARFGLHLALAKLADEINRALEVGDAVEAARLISAYFVECNLDVDQGTGTEQLLAYLQLRRLNQIKQTFAFQECEPPPAEPVPYTYDGRGYIWLIHKLADRYGWTREQIFNLWPEEVGAYLQEIMVAEYDEADQQRSISELAYHYDRNTKKATFIPIPRPDWIKGKSERKRYRIRRDMLPVGNIIDLTNATDKDFIH